MERPGECYAGLQWVDAEAAEDGVRLSFRQDDTLVRRFKNRVE